MSRVTDYDAVVQLSSSSLLQDFAPFTTVGAHPATVSRWTLDDVQHHIFFLVWVCGIPVHVRYVAHLLQHSAVGMSGVATAQKSVLAPVYQRGCSVNAKLRTWPATRALAPLSTPLSFLVPLGVAEAGCTATSAAHVRAVAVEPADDFTNVAALALYAVAEGNMASCGTASPIPLSSRVTPVGAVAVEPTWCSRAYWTAVSQARQWVDRFSQTSMTDATSAGVGHPTVFSPACTLVPPVPPRSAQAPPRRRRTRDHTTPVPAETVIVDAEEDDEGELAAFTNLPLPRTSGADVNAAKTETTVIVVDSDDE
jgi:hypothetical protein